MASKTTRPRPPQSSVKKGGLSPALQAMEHLRTADPVLYAAALPHLEDLEVRMKHRRGYRKLFEALAGSVVSQQLSTKAADTIWGRLEKVCKGAVTPEAIVKLRTTTMRSAGLSAAKVRTLKELSAALIAGTLSLERLRRIPEAKAIESLTAIWGIGTWTAEMFLIFALHRADVFSVQDLGLRRSVEALYGLPKDVPAAQIEAIAVHWAPHRSFASRALWRIRDSA